MINTIYTGLEEFEEKIDKIAEGEDDGENSWISKIYNQFSFFNDGQNSLEENDMDGLEPPILDETWGLGLRNAAKGEEDSFTFTNLHSHLASQILKHFLLVKSKTAELFLLSKTFLVFALKR